MSNFSSQTDAFSTSESLSLVNPNFRDFDYDKSTGWGGKGLSNPDISFLILDICAKIYIATYFAIGCNKELKYL